jgi:hypothetical protein
MIALGAVFLIASLLVGLTQLSGGIRLIGARLSADSSPKKQGIQIVGRKNGQFIVQNYLKPLVKSAAR